jgi:GNAT superfamily N-acetyltransferase
MDFQVNKLDLQGVEVLVDWARLEGWNPGVNDAAIFYNFDPNGFFGYFLNGEMIGGGSIVSYNGDFGFMGFFIVSDQYRGQGVGRKLWLWRKNHLIQRLEPNAVIGMDGVVSMQPFYAKGGFQLAFRDERYERKGEVFQNDFCVSPISMMDFDTIDQYDRRFFLYPRRQFLQNWIFQPDAFAFKYAGEHGIMGYCVMRKATNGYKIGPLFAENPFVADALYKTCLSHADGKPTYLDIPATNSDAVDLVKKHKATYVFECARMYLGQQPQIPIEKIFGITSFELG